MSQIRQRDTRHIRELLTSQLAQLKEINATIVCRVQFYRLVGSSEEPDILDMYIRGVSEKLYIGSRLMRFTPHSAD